MRLGKDKIVALLDPRVSEAIGVLQALDDAIEFRLGRLNQPCRDCVGRQKCAVHSFDERLVVRYQARYAAAFKNALADMDPDVIEQVMKPGVRVRPATFLLGTAILTRLLEIDDDGSSVAELDGPPAVSEPDGHAVIGHRCCPTTVRADKRSIRGGWALAPRHCASARTGFLRLRSA